MTVLIPCRVCGKPKERGAYYPSSTSCIPCYQAQRAEYNRARNARRREERRARTLNQPFVRAVPDRFEPTRKALKTHWGLPFARWTRWHHEQHSTWLRRLAGLPDAPTVDATREAA